MQLLSTYEQARYNLFPYRLTASQAWPLEWLATTDGDQIKLENLALPALRPGSNEDHPLRQYVAAMPPPRHMNLLERMYDDFLQSYAWICLKKHILSSAVKIDNIVCIAFGTLTDESRPKARLRSHQQHFLARAIADALENHHTIADEKENPGIPIVAYDPDYRIGDMSILSSVSPSIAIVSMPHHFLSLHQTRLSSSPVPHRELRSWKLLLTFCTQLGQLRS